MSTDPHECPGVADCFTHPRWHVWRVYPGGRWRATLPLLQGGKSFDTFPEALAYATSQARAQMVAAAQDGAA